MITFSEAQLVAWLSPVLWPFLRVLAMFSVAPVFSQRVIPMRLKIGLAFLVAVCAQPVLGDQPVIGINSPQALGTLIQQVGVGLAVGFAVRLVFAAVEVAGEVVGLQMGLNFASFFDPLSGGQATAVSRFYGTCASWLFVVMNGHLLITMALLNSFTSFPVSPDPMDFVRTLQPQVWGAEIFRLGLWVALPILAMLTLVNMVMGVIARVAPQMNVFSVGFPVSIGVGITGLWLTLPMMQAPFTAALERMLGYFQ